MLQLLRHTTRLARLFGGDLRVGTMAVLRALATSRILCNLQPGRPAGRCGDRSARRPEFMEGLFRGFGQALFLATLMLSGFAGSVAHAATPGEPIPNFATLRFAVGGVPDIKDSNTVVFTVRSPAVIEFLKYAPRPESGGESVPVAATYYDSGGGSFTLIPQPPPTLNPTVPLLGTPIYYLGETIYLRLTDLDQNLDPTLAETVIITVSCTETGDSETLRLTETGPGTGVFSGYLPTSTSNAALGANGTLVVTDKCHLQASYTDTLDLIKTVVDAALVDPYGVVFDSRTGQPVDGATVTLIDVATGQPAQVFGDDGVSIYQPDGSPTGTATVVTGGTATDESGAFYQLPPGGFRFPYIVPGTYRLRIIPPSGYVNPSTVADNQLQIVFPGAALVLGSRGENFPVNPGPALQIDIPIDPLDNGLWLLKQVNRDQASTGDFLQYRLTLENNNSVATAPQAVISDRLPLGFRFQKGSARINGDRSADPLISTDGRTLTFNVGDLLPATQVEVTYVVEVAAGAKAGNAVNQAQAVDNSGAYSNVARATVLVKEEFFRNKTFLIGRVLTGSCSQDDTEMSGLPGVRIFLEDGSFAVTDKDGKYHFEGIDPGTHVVQVDLATLPVGYEMIPCEETSQFAERNFSQFVDLKGGTLWRVNFYTAPLPPPTGEVSLELFSSLEGSVATFRTVITSKTVAVDNLRLTIMLPGAAEFIPGSVRQDGQSLADPPFMAGAVNLRSLQVAAGQSTELTFQARLDIEETDGELPAKALLTFDSPTAKNQRTPIAENRFLLSTGSRYPSEEIRLHPHFPVFVAELQPNDLLMLEELASRLQQEKIVRVDIVGHTDNQEIASRSKYVFADNQSLSEGRAGSVAAFLRQRLNIPEAVITMRGFGETMPVASNGTEAGRARNRRVELYLVTEAVSTPGKAEVTKGASEPQTAATVGANTAEVKFKTARMTAPRAAKAPERTGTWLISLKPETQIVWPEADYVPEIPSTTILIAHPQGSQVDLQLNGRKVDALNFDTSKPVPNSKFVVSNWEGVALRDGLNRIEASISTSDGQPARLIEREIWYVTQAEKLEWLEDKSTMFADGIHPPTLALRLTDRDGHPLRPGQQVEYRVSAPYLALRDKTTEDTNKSTAVGILVTGTDGLAYAQLEPTPQAGEVTVSLQLPGKPLEIQTRIKPAMRDWILVGFAEGTLGYSTLSGNMVSARETDSEEHGYTDGQVKFFAKGTIKGEWLLTLAYDSDKRSLDGDSLRQIIDPDNYYPLYGDGTQQGYEAASARKLYVKIERDQFYALFGDMQTGLTRTVLSQYSRSLNGFKAEQQGEHFTYTVFAADTRQAFVKDELRGDGTSGRYRLSQKNLVINSEEVVIETRDRFHNERILKEERLSRHVDYDIDYNAGTLFFKRPIASKDHDFNPLFIVVRYEASNATGTNLNYGGRGAVKLLDGKIEAGTTLIHEQSGVAKGDLYGADLTVKLTPQTTLRVEVASSEVEAIDETRKGDAYLAEVQHQSERFDGRVWFRQQDPQFGLGQQNGSTGGMRTYGADGAYHLNPQWSLAGEAYREDNLETDAKRDVESLEARYRTERFGLRTGLREARDKFASGETQRSRQLLLGGDWNTSDSKLTLRATHEQSLAGKNQNTDYPTRTTLGADYQLTKDVTVFAEQELTWGDYEDTQGTRAGLKATPWQGGEVRTSMERQTGENGERVFALFGVGQSWQVSEEWSVDLSVDRSHTIKHKNNTERVNDEVPPASGGDDDFTAISMGAARKTAKWSWWNRLEVRQGDSEDRLGVSTGLVGELRDGVATSARLMAFISNSSGGNKRDEEEIRLGLAYRPNQSRWIFLERLDLSLSNEKGNSSDSDSMRIVNHLHANFRANRQWQTSLYYGLKYVRENYYGDRFAGFTDMIAIETRYNLTKRWDLGLHGSLLHSWNSHQFDYSLGADVGYLLMTNAWVSAGYNLAGFEDKDFSAANYTAQGPYLRVRVKFDQQSVREAAEWINK